mgnify:CR=1 FL=1
MRVYVIPPGRKPVRLPSLPENDPDFIAAYARAVEASPKRAPTGAPRAGTLAALAQSYRQSPGWRALAGSSRRQKEREIARLVEKAGNVCVVGIAARHIRADLALLSPGAASNRLKAWRALMKHAVELGLIERDPARDVRTAPQAGEGHHSWTCEEVAAFRAHWPIGSEQRLAFELSYWTGARRGDLVKLGWQMVDDEGWLHFKQTKTGGQVSIPFRRLPPGCAPLARDYEHLQSALEMANGRMLFLATAYGRPRSAEGMGNWFAEACKAAELPDGCRLHGLRKARATRLAELGWSAHRIGAWTGHETLSEVEHYTTAASRKRLIEGHETGKEWGT